MVSVAGAKFRFSTKARAKDTPGTLWVVVSALMHLDAVTLSGPDSAKVDSA